MCLGRADRIREERERERERAEGGRKGKEGGLGRRGGDLVVCLGEGGSDERGERVSCKSSQSCLTRRTHLTTNRRVREDRQRREGVRGVPKIPGMSVCIARLIVTMVC